MHEEHSLDHSYRFKEINMTEQELDSIPAPLAALAWHNFLKRIDNNWGTQEVKEVLFKELKQYKDVQPPQHDVVLNHPMYEEVLESELITQSINDLKAFLRGTSVPDIARLNKMKRYTTTAKKRTTADSETEMSAQRNMEYLVTDSELVLTLIQEKIIQIVQTPTLLQRPDILVKLNNVKSRNEQINKEPKNYSISFLQERYHNILELEKEVDIIIEELKKAQT